MKPINEKIAEITEEIEMFDDWMDKYNYLIELGKTVPVIDEQYKQKQYLISGCQSQVWLHASLDDGVINFTADSDALISKGIIHLLIKVMSGSTPDEILNADLSFIEKTGLSEHLSPTRANGLASMVKQIRLYALAYKAKLSQQ